jgi:DNA-directed RNA polymerase subunit RPC12/RpoP
MTSPPFRYVCKKCKHENWLMPHPESFHCEKCNAKNKVIVLLPKWWITRLVKEKGA